MDVARVHQYAESHPDATFFWIWRNRAETPSFHVLFGFGAEAHVSCEVNPHPENADS